MVSTGSKVLVYDDGVNLIYTDGKLIVTTFGDADGFNIGINVGTDLVSLY